MSHVIEYKLDRINQIVSLRRSDAPSKVIEVDRNELEKILDDFSEKETWKRL